MRRAILGVSITPRLIHVRRVVRRRADSCRRVGAALPLRRLRQPVRNVAHAANTLVAAHETIKVMLTRHALAAIMYPCTRNRSPICPPTAHTCTSGCTAHLPPPCLPLPPHHPPLSSSTHSTTRQEQCRGFVRQLHQEPAIITATPARALQRLSLTPMKAQFLANILRRLPALCAFAAAHRRLVHAAEVHRGRHGH